MDALASRLVELELPDQAGIDTEEPGLPLDDDALAYPRWLAFLVPAMSAPIKLLLKRYGVGGLVLVGGLTNLWNFLFFACATYTVWCDR